LHVITPQQRWWKPRLREAAGTLGASGGRHGKGRQLKINGNNG